MCVRVFLLRGKIHTSTAVVIHKIYFVLRLPVGRIIGPFYGKVEK